MGTPASPLLVEEFYNVIIAGSMYLLGKAASEILAKWTMEDAEKTGTVQLKLALMNREHQTSTGQEQECERSQIVEAVKVTEKDENIDDPSEEIDRLRRQLSELRENDRRTTEEDYEFANILTDLVRNGALKEFPKPSLLEDFNRQHNYELFLRLQRQVEREKRLNKTLEKQLISIKEEDQEAKENGKSGREQNKSDLFRQEIEALQESLREKDAALQQMKEALREKTTKNQHLRDERDCYVELSKKKDDRLCFLEKEQLNHEKKNGYMQKEVEALTMDLNKTKDSLQKNERMVVEMREHKARIEDEYHRKLEKSRLETLKKDQEVAHWHKQKVLLDEELMEEKKLRKDIEEELIIAKEEAKNLEQENLDMKVKLEEFQLEALETRNLIGPLTEEEEEEEEEEEKKEVQDKAKHNAGFIEKERFTKEADKEVQTLNEEIQALKQIHNIKDSQILQLEQEKLQKEKEIKCIHNETLALKEELILKEEKEDKYKRRIKRIEEMCEQVNIMFERNMEEKNRLIQDLMEEEKLRQEAEDIVHTLNEEIQALKQIHNIKDSQVQLLKQEKLEKENGLSYWKKESMVTDKELKDTKVELEEEKTLRKEIEEKLYLMEERMKALEEERSIEVLIDELFNGNEDLLIRQGGQSSDVKLRLEEVFAPENNDMKEQEKIKKRRLQNCLKNFICLCPCIIPIIIKRANNNEHNPDGLKKVLMEIKDSIQHYEREIERAEKEMELSIARMIQEDRLGMETGVHLEESKRLKQDLMEEEKLRQEAEDIVHTLNEEIQALKQTNNIKDSQILQLEQEKLQKEKEIECIHNETLALKEELIFKEEKEDKYKRRIKRIEEMCEQVNIMFERNIEEKNRLIQDLMEEEKLRQEAEDIVHTLNEEVQALKQTNNIKDSQILQLEQEKLQKEKEIECLHNETLALKEELIFKEEKEDKYKRRIKRIEEMCEQVNIMFERNIEEKNRLIQDLMEEEKLRQEAEDIVHTLNEEVQALKQTNNIKDSQILQLEQEKLQKEKEIECLHNETLALKEELIFKEEKEDKYKRRIKRIEEMCEQVNIMFERNIEEKNRLIQDLMEEEKLRQEAEDIVHTLNEEVQALKQTNNIKDSQVQLLKQEKLEKENGLSYWKKESMVTDKELKDTKVELEEEKTLRKEIEEKLYLMEERMKALEEERSIEVLIDELFNGNEDLLIRQGGQSSDVKLRLEEVFAPENNDMKEQEKIKKRRLQNCLKNFICLCPCIIPIIIKRANNNEHNPDGLKKVLMEIKDSIQHYEREIERAEKEMELSIARMIQEDRLGMETGVHLEENKRLKQDLMEEEKLRQEAEDIVHTLNEEVQALKQIHNIKDSQILQLEQEKLQKEKEIECLHNETLALKEELILKEEKEDKHKRKIAGIEETYEQVNIMFERNMEEKNRLIQDLMEEEKLRQEAEDIVHTLNEEVQALKQIHNIKDSQILQLEQEKLQKEKEIECLHNETLALKEELILKEEKEDKHKRKIAGIEETYEQVNIMFERNMEEKNRLIQDLMEEEKLRQEAEDIVHTLNEEVQALKQTNNIKDSQILQLEQEKLQKEKEIECLHNETLALKEELILKEEKEDKYKRKIAGIEERCKQVNIMFERNIEEKNRLIQDLTEEKKLRQEAEDIVHTLNEEVQALKQTNNIKDSQFLQLEQEKLQKEKEIECLHNETLALKEELILKEEKEDKYKRKIAGIEERCKQVNIMFERNIEEKNRLIQDLMEEKKLRQEAEDIVHTLNEEVQALKQTNNIKDSQFLQLEQEKLQKEKEIECLHNETLALKEELILKEEKEHKYKRKIAGIEERCKQVNIMFERNHEEKIRLIQDLMEEEKLRQEAEDIVHTLNEEVQALKQTNNIKDSQILQLEQEKLQKEKEIECLHNETLALKEELILKEEKEDKYKRKIAGIEERCKQVNIMFERNHEEKIRLIQDLMEEEKLRQEAEDIVHTLNEEVQALKQTNNIKDSQFLQLEQEKLQKEKEIECLHNETLALKEELILKEEKEDKYKRKIAGIEERCKQVNIMFERNIEEKNRLIQDLMEEEKLRQEAEDIVHTLNEEIQALKQTNNIKASQFLQLKQEKLEKENGLSYWKKESMVTDKELKDTKVELEEEKTLRKEIEEKLYLMEERMKALEEERSIEVLIDELFNGNEDLLIRQGGQSSDVKLRLEEVFAPENNDMKEQEKIKKRRLQNCLKNFICLCPCIIPIIIKRANNNEHNPDGLKKVLMEIKDSIQHYEREIERAEKEMELSIARMIQEDRLGMETGVHLEESKRLKQDLMEEEKLRQEAEDIVHTLNEEVQALKQTNNIKDSQILQLEQEKLQKEKEIECLHNETLALKEELILKEEKEDKYKRKIAGIEEGCKQVNIMFERNIEEKNRLIQDLMEEEKLRQEAEDIVHTLNEEVQALKQTNNIKDSQFLQLEQEKLQKEKEIECLHNETLALKEELILKEEKEDKYKRKIAGIEERCKQVNIMFERNIEEKNRLIQDLMEEKKLRQEAEDIVHTLNEEVQALKQTNNIKDSQFLQLEQEKLQKEKEIECLHNETLALKEELILKEEKEDKYKRKIAGIEEGCKQVNIMFERNIEEKNRLIQDLMEEKKLRQEAEDIVHTLNEEVQALKQTNNIKDSQFLQLEQEKLQKEKEIECLHNETLALKEELILKEEKEDKYKRKIAGIEERCKQVNIMFERNHEEKIRLIQDLMEEEKLRQEAEDIVHTLNEEVQALKQTNNIKDSQFLQLEQEKLQKEKEIECLHNETLALKEELILKEEKEDKYKRKIAGIEERCKQVNIMFERNIEEKNRLIQDLMEEEKLRQEAEDIVHTLNEEIQALKQTNNIKDSQFLQLKQEKLEKENGLSYWKKESMVTDKELKDTKVELEEEKTLRKEIEEKLYLMEERMKALEEERSIEVLIDELFNGNEDLLIRQGGQSSDVKLRLEEVFAPENNDMKEQEKIKKRRLQNCLKNFICLCPCIIPIIIKRANNNEHNPDGLKKVLMEIKDSIQHYEREIERAEKEMELSIARMIQEDRLGMETGVHLEESKRLKQDLMEEEKLRQEAEDIVHTLNEEVQALKQTNNIKDSQILQLEQEKLQKEKEIECLHNETLALKEELILKEEKEDKYKRRIKRIEEGCKQVNIMFERNIEEKNRLIQDLMEEEKLRQEAEDIVHTLNEEVQALKQTNNIKDSQFLQLEQEKLQKEKEIECLHNETLALKEELILKEEKEDKYKRRIKRIEEGCKQVNIMFERNIEEKNRLIQDLMEEEKLRQEAEDIVHTLNEEVQALKQTNNIKDSQFLQLEQEKLQKEKDTLGMETGVHLDTMEIKLESLEQNILANKDEIDSVQKVAEELNDLMNRLKDKVTKE
ncbi:trichohyalin-like [Palaemon carinicauda]|uniref:trichohyalin-like n=1 Tax=Palaemon carinicauda TaxID=392227 RepID=UPI0035B65955